MPKDPIDINNITPQELAERGAALIVELSRLGFRPLLDPVDLLLLSILPLAIKKVRTGDPFVDHLRLSELMAQLDLKLLTQLMS